MTQVKRLMLDILKPHKPNALDFASSLAGLSEDLEVTLTVTEVDERTESVQILLLGSDINFQRVSERIKELGASVHSIDEVCVVGSTAETAAQAQAINT